MRSAIVYCRFFVLLGIAAFAHAGDPWVDSSLPLDQDAAKLVLRELNDAATALYKSAHARLHTGSGGVVEEVEARCAVFQAQARYAWVEGQFISAFRATEYATMAADELVSARRESHEVGQGTLKSVFEAQRQRADARLALLRIQAEATRRDVEVSPATSDMAKEAIERLLR